MTLHNLIPYLHETLAGTPDATVLMSRDASPCGGLMISQQMTKSGRPLLLSFQDEYRKRFRTSCFIPGVSTKQVPLVQEGGFSKVENATPCSDNDFQNEKKISDKGNKYGLIYDATECKALEATVFGKLLKNENDSENSSSDEHETVRVKAEIERDNRILSENVAEYASSLDECSEDEVSNQQNEAVWIDSDDDNLEVDLLSRAKLHKLRNEGKRLSRSKTTVSGREYRTRLFKFHVKGCHGVAEDWIEQLKKNSISSSKIEEQEEEESEDYTDRDDDNNTRGKNENARSKNCLNVRMPQGKLIASTTRILRSKYSERVSTKLSYRMLPDGNRAEPSK